MFPSHDSKQYKKQNTSIEGVKEITKHQVPRVLKFFYTKETPPTNLELMEASLIRHIQSEEYTFEEFYRKLDVIHTMCVEEEFNSAEFSRIFERESLDISAYVWHECLYRLAISSKHNQMEVALSKLIQEIDIQRNIYGKDSRAILNTIVNANKDLLLVNGDMGGASESSPLSQYKRNKLSQYSGVDCLRLLSILNLILTNESRYKNSPNILVEIQTHLTPALMEGIQA